MITRCKKSGYYANNVFCDLKTNVMSKFCLIVQRMRKDPNLNQNGYPIVVSLTLDVATEWSEKCVVWTTMCSDMGITLQYASIDDKRANADAESAVKHLTHTAKCILLESSLPA